MRLGARGLGCDGLESNAARLRTRGFRWNGPEADDVRFRWNWLKPDGAAEIFLVEHRAEGTTSESESCGTSVVRWEDEERNTADASDEGF